MTFITHRTRQRLMTLELQRERRARKIRAALSIAIMCASCVVAGWMLGLWMAHAAINDARSKAQVHNTTSEGFWI